MSFEEYLKKDGETMEYCVRRKSDDKLFQFYAGTGKIMGFENKMCIHSFWDYLRRKKIALLAVRM